MKTMNKHQQIEIDLHIEAEYNGSEIELMSEVKHIMIDYPFRIDHNGSQNVYDIKPTSSLRELIAETQKVFVREYEAGNCDAPHDLSDFWFEHITVHKNNCANIYFGS